MNNVPQPVRHKLQRKGHNLSTRKTNKSKLFQRQRELINKVAIDQSAVDMSDKRFRTENIPATPVARQICVHLIDFLEGEKLPPNKLDARWVLLREYDLCHEPRCFISHLATCPKLPK